ncbi:hypothetical protein [Pedobacter gandavensis]|uniref:hypothetical protein n=1 Tax=Pedobacter gandavensis TaxID=2679963 RepID=UPI00292E4BBD|nr:hypothetical protein [Pedobacter gandavensis]
MKSLFYSLAVAATALGMSAFTSTPDKTVGEAKRVGAITANFIIQPEEDEFRQFPVGTPDGQNCRGVSEMHCYYSVNPLGKDSIPDLPSYTDEQIELYLANEWIEPGSTSVDESLYPDED